MLQTWNERTIHPAELVGEEPDDLKHARAVEQKTDELMAKCVTLHGADMLNLGNDLYDGMLLPQLMQEIALWSGRSDDAAVRMRSLHNLLANELQKIAEREVKA